MVGVEHTKGASDSSVLGTNVTDITQCRNWYMLNSVTAMFNPQLTALKARRELGREGLPPTRRRPWFFANWAIY